jgi:hypothetical protein
MLSSKERGPGRESALNLRCDVFNREHPIGSEVRFHPVIGGPAFRVRKVRTAAFVLSGHTAVVFLEGEPGCVAVEACKPVGGGK